MNKLRLLIIFICTLIFPPVAFAGETTPQLFQADLAPGDAVTTNGGNITATIDPNTGALNTSFTPGFTMTTTTGSAQSLTYTATSNTQAGLQNAIFNIGTTKYIILTNSTTLPAVSSVNDIKTGSPTAANNPNAIAYVINDPPTISGRLTVAYDTTNKLWNLVLTRNGNTNTSITVPAGVPLSNTYSNDDEVGTYQATITLSFI